MAAPTPHRRSTAPALHAVNLAHVLSVRPLALVAVTTLVALVAVGVAVSADLADARVSIVPVGGIPADVAAGAGGVWVALGIDGLAFVDPATERVERRLRPGGAVVGLAIGAGAVWAVDVFGDRLLRIDPRRRAVTGSTPIPGMPSTVVAGGRWIWVLTHAPSGVVRVDAANGRVVQRVALDGAWPGGLARAPGGVWALHARGRRVVRLRVATEPVSIVLDIPLTRSIAARPGSLWLARPGSERPLRVDARTFRAHELPAATPSGDDGYGPVLEAGGPMVWLLTSDRILGLDPRSGSIRVSRLVRGLRADGHLPAAVFARGLWLAGRARSIVRVDVGRPRR